MRKWACLVMGKWWCEGGMEAVWGGGVACRGRFHVAGGLRPVSPPGVQSRAVQAENACYLIIALTSVGFHRAPACR